MRGLVFLVFILTLCTSPFVAIGGVRDPVLVVPTPAVVDSFTVLCFHEVRDDVRDYPDPFAVDASALVRQLAWLRGNGYTPVSLDQIIAARRGGNPLPEKAVLLSFDDAYQSFYERVYPLLREFHFPAVLGVVGKWIDSPRDGPVLYGEKATVSNASFPTWKQIREMADSGLVEIASHSYDLHRGVLANPQGNVQPAATARIYDVATARYEDDASWRARVRADLARNSNVIERETGRRPRVVVWPYGSYNNELVHIAGELGMPIALTLEDGTNTPDVPLTAMRRILVQHNPALSEFANEVRGPRYPQPVRVVQVNLDDVYSEDTMQQERNLSLLLDRIVVLKPTHIYLQATADTNDDGIADAAYFPNRYLPLRADLFNRVEWQLATRSDVKVFAVMPVTGFHLPRNNIAEIYEDLARNANFDGLVFDDKPTSSARAGLTDAADVVEFTRQLTARASAFRAPLKAVHTVYAKELSGSAAALPVAQDLSRFFTSYDNVALVIPTPASASDVDPWPIELLDEPGLRRKVVFILRNNRGIQNNQSDTALAHQMRRLQLNGASNFGYGPDDFMHNNPPLAEIAPVISLREYPLTRERK